MNNDSHVRLMRRSLATARILLVAEDVAAGAGICEILNQGLSAETGQVRSAKEALDKLQESRWDLLVLIVRTPDEALLPLQCFVLVHPDKLVLVMGVEMEPPDARSLLAAGARGCLCTRAAAAELPRAVRVVLGGRRYVGLSLVEAMSADLQQLEGKPLHARLSAREFQIFCEIARGHTVSFIAEELCLSVKTVSTYRTRIMEKMNFKTNANITAYAMKTQLMNVGQGPVR